MHPTFDPARRECLGSWKGPSVEFVDRVEDRIFHLRGHVDIDLTRPRLLAIPMVPLAGSIRESVELRASVGDACPHVRDCPTELSVPQQRRQVVEGNDHADMIDGAVGRCPDCTVGS